MQAGDQRKRKPKVLSYCGSMAWAHFVESLPINTDCGSSSVETLPIKGLVAHNCATMDPLSKQPWCTRSWRICSACSNLRKEQFTDTSSSPSEEQGNWWTLENRFWDMGGKNIELLRLQQKSWTWICVNTLLFFFNSPSCKYLTSIAGRSRQE